MRLLFGECMSNLLTILIFESEINPIYPASIMVKL